MPEQPARQPRERAARCRRCFRQKTWNVNAVCDGCQTRQATR